MKITDVVMDCYVWPQPKPIRNGKYTYTTNGIDVVRVETDQGITGLGLGTLGTGSDLQVQRYCGGWRRVLGRP